MAKTDKRVVLHSILTKEGWAVKRENKEALSLHDTQRECEAAAIQEAKRIQDNDGLSQVIFHKENGEIREERTYGKDPERHPG